MNPAYYSINLLALVICAIMGTVVLGTNAYRRSNRAFALFSLVIALWLMSRIRVIKATEIEVLTFLGD